jgi:hypothetical protein
VSDPSRRRLVVLTLTTLALQAGVASSQSSPGRASERVFRATATTSPERDIDHRSVQAEQRLVGNLNPPPAIENCGCYFYRDSRQRPGDLVYFFDLSGLPLMNVQGNNTQVSPDTQSDLQDWPTRRGGRFRWDFSAGQVRITVRGTATRVCAPDDERCESTDFDVSIEARCGSARQTLHAVGGCGC